MKQFRDTEYYVTEDGDVYSKKYHPKRNPNCEMRKLKPFLNTTSNYLKIKLSGVLNKKFYIHRLVAECYLPNPNNLPLVEHRDDIKTNNHVSNLMWSNHADNSKHANENGLIPKGEKHLSSKLTEKEVKWIRENYIPKHREFSSRALARKLNVTQKTILNIIKNKTWTHI
jgi:hypothetical protein